MAVSTNKRFPGFGLPVDHEGEDVASFPLAIGQPWSSSGVSLREQRMLDFINKITDKPGWDTKVFDEGIVSRWRAEADVRPEELGGDVYLSQKMFDFSTKCIAELRDKSEQFQQTGRVRVLDSELVVLKSDRAISNETRDELRVGVKVLEDVPEHEKDWHPDSDDQVLDLVHPSLFPVVWGLTRALEEGTVPLDGCVGYTGKGAVVPHYTAQPRPAAERWGQPPPPKLWGSFQWLPTQVELAADGSARITSYINNLHPVQHKSLYCTLERIVAATIPLWEDTLNGFGDHRRFDLADTGSYDYTYPPGLQYQIPGRQGRRSLFDPINHTYADAETEDGEKASGPGDDDNNEDDEDDDDEDWRYEDHFHYWQRANRILLYREPRNYIPQVELAKGVGTGGTDRGTISFRNRFPAGLQVIFKLANIHLTPEDPSYEGGSWHVEGTLNEMICASAIYYYDQDNITDSHLAFRQAMDTDKVAMIPDQYEYDSLLRYFGVEEEGPAIQNLGQVLTREGRLLVFPNCLQHQVQPFELQDDSRDGHRKILAMFLVNPHRPILSTAHVPPQRHDWWADEMRKEGGLPGLPNEITDMIMDAVDDFPISWEQALDFRERLMEERSDFNDQLNDHFESEPFNFCEH
ncbi:uncharacterized protein B0H64DRAFT_377587 [Chaetomium fimeti]|uniref:Uncharacterized protein n=1 Tax=Chaetomium fimeti TaxID=1854472 RepID=A0AAE0H8W9_9PEZI|nr:hypothetical protein B0H64DRAFT_377587 [Chaetomium fimeti]